MNKRREKARIIAQKGKALEQRDRLESILIQKLHVEHGPHSLNPISKSEIGKLVREHIDKYPSIGISTDGSNKGDLEEIMVKVQTKVAERKGTSRSKPDNEKMAVVTKCNCEHKQPADTLCSQSKEKVASITDVNPWTLMETFKIIEAKKAKVAQKSKAVQKRQEMASTLNDQIRCNEEVSRLEKLEDENFLEIQRKSLEQWKNEQDTIIQKEEQKILRLRKARQEQVEESKRIREHELHEARLRELKEIQDLQVTLKNEKDRKQQEKERERQMWRLIKEENVKEIAERKLQKVREAAMDAKLMEDMKVKYDLDEKRKVEAMGEKVGKAKDNFKKLFEAVALKKREETVEFEKRLLEQAQAREQMQVAEELRKRKALQKKKRDITESNRKLAEEKCRREKILEKEKESYSFLCLKEQEVLLEEEEALRAKQKETKQRYRQNLHNQIEEKHSLKTDSDGMTSVERSINKKIMMKIENSSIMKNIAEKLL